MVNHNNLYIDDEHILQSLNSIVQSSSRRIDSNPLEFLLVVDFWLQKNELSVSACLRRYALSSYLISTITYLYNQIRSFFGLSSPELIVTLDQVLLAIAADASIGQSHLAGLSWLYFHYAYTQYHISRSDFASIAHIDDRTLRRYQKLALDQLVARVLEEELTLRKTHLSLKLPHHGNVRLFGRNEELQTILSVLSQNRPAHVQITGLQGVGKSVLAEVAVQELVSQNCVDKLIWVTASQSVDHLQTIISQEMFNPDYLLTMAQFCSIRRVCIVIELAESFAQEASNLNELFLELSGALIIVVSRSIVPITDCYTLALKGLSRSETSLFLASKSPHPTYVSSEIAEELWQITGGNPSALQAFCQFQQFGSINARVVLYSSYEAVYHNLSISDKLTWLLMSFWEDQGISSEDLFGIFPLQITSQNLQRLINKNILQVNFDEKPHNCLINKPTAQFIRQQYQIDSLLAGTFKQLIMDSDLSIRLKSDFLYQFVKLLLSTNWLKLPFEWKTEAMRSLWDLISNKGDWTGGQILLSEYKEDDLETSLFWGICVRNSGNWRSAYHHFEKLACDAGNIGEFNIQMRALLELSITLRLMGKNKSALAVINQIKKQKVSLPDTYMEQILFEQAELDIELRMPEFTENIIFQLPEKPRRTYLYLLYLINFKRSSLEKLETVAESVIELFSNDYRALARIYTLVGMVMIEHYHYTESVAYFTSAMTLAEQIDDLFILGRSQTNTASALIHIQKYSHACDLLMRSAKIQHTIGDTIGLAITTYNQKLLARNQTL